MAAETFLLNTLTVLLVIIALIVVPQILAPICNGLVTLFSVLAHTVVGSIFGAAASVRNHVYFIQRMRKKSKNKTQVKQEYFESKNFSKPGNDDPAQCAQESKLIYGLIDDIEEKACRCAKCQLLIGNIYEVKDMRQMAGHPIGSAFRKEVFELTEVLEEVLDGSKMTMEDDTLLALKLALELQRKHCGPYCEFLNRSRVQAKAEQLCPLAQFFLSIRQDWTNAPTA